MRKLSITSAHIIKHGIYVDIRVWVCVCLSLLLFSSWRFTWSVSRTSTNMCLHNILRSRPAFNRFLLTRHWWGRQQCSKHGENNNSNSNKLNSTQGLVGASWWRRTWQPGACLRQRFSLSQKIFPSARFVQLSAVATSRAVELRQLVPFLYLAWQQNQRKTRRRYGGFKPKRVNSLSFPTKKFRAWARRNNIPI